MTRVCLSALLSHWRRNPLQLFTFLAGLALATGLWAGVQAINAEARASYDAAAQTLGEGRFAQVEHLSGQRFSQDIYIALRRAGWQVTPVLEGTRRANDTRIRIIGLDLLIAPAGLGPDTEAQDLALQDLLRPGVLFANADIADALAEITDLRIVTDANIAPGTAIADIGVAQRLLNASGLLSRLIVATEQPLGLVPLEQIAPELTVTPPQSGSDVSQLTGSFHLNLTAFGLLSFAVGLFIVHGTIGLAFELRRPMIRTLRSLGVPLKHLVVLLAVELLLLALIAGAIGVALGYLIAALLLPDVAATLSGLYGAQVSGSLESARLGGFRASLSRSLVRWRQEPARFCKSRVCQS